MAKINETKKIDLCQGIVVNGQLNGVTTKESYQIKNNINNVCMLCDLRNDCKEGSICEALDVLDNEFFVLAGTLCRHLGEREVHLVMIDPRDHEYITNETFL